MIFLYTFGPMKCLPVILMCLAAAVSCGGGPKGPSPVKTRAFPRVSAPAMIESREEMVAFMAEHFWDAFMDTAKRWYSDSSIVNGVPVEEVESAVGLYVTVIEGAPREVAAKGLGTLAARACAAERADTSSTVLETMELLIRKYLYDPNSPLRDEDLFGAFALALSGNDVLPEIRRAPYAREASLCSLNSVGTRAADFPFTDSRDRQRTLYGIKADWTVLIFGNPLCGACKELMEAMSADEGISALVKKGRVAVADIYIDEDLDEWRSSASSYPREWINGYDHQYKIRTDLVYHVRAIPSMYILDRDKTVVMKDAPQEKILEFLSEISENHGNN